jgi:hypothetical protein
MVDDNHSVHIDLRIYRAELHGDGRFPSESKVDHWQMNWGLPIWVL